MILTTKQDEAMLLALSGLDVAIKSGKGAGASTALGECVVSLMEQRTSCILLTSPTRALTRDVLMGCICAAARRRGVTYRRSSTTHIYIEQSVAMAWSGTKVMLPRIQAGTGIVSRAAANDVILVVDCADSVPARVLIDLEDHVGRGVQTLMAGCPFRRTGLLWHAFRWNRISMPSTEAPAVSDEFLDRMKKQFGEDSPTYQSRIRAEFPSEGKQ